MEMAFCVHGMPVKPAVPTAAMAKATFVALGEVDHARAHLVDRIKSRWLRENPAPTADVAPYWALYQHVFSPEGLQSSDPQLLKDFANSRVGAAPGNMSGFNQAWNEMGSAAAARRTRDTISHLLYGPGDLEDRLTELIVDSKGVWMPGFKEALLTRALCVMHPHEFLPILIYTSPAGGKKEIAKSVWDLDLPPKDATTMTIGRMIIWSNDILVRLAGDGFAHLQHVAHFLWDVKDSAAELAEQV